MDTWGGAPAELVRALSEEVGEFEVEPENWETVCLFMAVQTQWRIGFSGPSGLDYTAVKATMDILGVTDQPAVFAGIRIMECAALQEMGRRDAK